MDQYHYARYVQRAEMPRKGNAQGFQKRQGVYYLFEQHYPMSKTHVQILRKHARTVQNVGPQCLRSDVNQGEDNAMHKTFFFTCVHCTGVDECANPLICGPMLFPYCEEDEESTNTQQQRTLKRFAPAWKARRAEIEVLADRAALKHDEAKRIGVIHDTTAFKGVRITRSAATEHASPEPLRQSIATERASNSCSDAATEPIFDGRIQQILIQQVVYQTMPRGTCLERVAYSWRRRTMTA